MVKGIQILGMVVGLYLIMQTLLNFRNGNYGFKRTIFWMFLWSVMFVLFFNPSLAVLALPILTTQDMIMSVLVVSVLTLFIFLTHMNQQIAKFGRELTELVQNLAIQNYLNKSLVTVSKEDEQ